MIVVPATITLLDGEQAARALVAAWPEIDRESAALFLALIWIETGSGRATQHNPGNLSAAESFAGKAWRPPWFEVTAESAPRMIRLHELMLAGKAPSAFRAYDSFEDGFADFARLLKRPEYSPLRAAAETGEPVRFRAALAERYSADYTQAHDAALTDLRRRFAPLVIDQPAPSSSSSSSSSSPGGLGALALLFALRSLTGIG